MSGEPLLKVQGVETYYGNMRTKMYNYFIANGVIMRPVGNIIYILPPYIMTDRQLDAVYQVIRDVLEIV